MANQWFKFYGGEYLSDPKIISLSPQERSCWITIMCMASTSSVQGVIEFLTPDVLMYQSGIRFDPSNTGEWEKCYDVLKKFEKMKMITVNENGVVEVLNWNKRQEYTMTATERSRKFRAKQKENQEDATEETESNENATLEENRIEENRIDKKKHKNDSKESYGEFNSVKLTTDEYTKLVERMGEKNTRLMIAQLDTYIASKGKRYSSHYATILNWARRKVEEMSKQPTKNKNAF